MFGRAKEYLKLGAGKPFGTVWSMERAYFQYRRKYPGREEPAYLRLALESRYPEKPAAELLSILSNCKDLEDVMVKALSLDFGQAVAVRFRLDVLWALPRCSSCGKYRALSAVDSLCYGCRNFPGFAACTKCHLYWDDSPRYCQKCGGQLWKICDGPGVSMIPLD